jgi:lauroyl/myristoyl acyltransferase
MKGLESYIFGRLGLSRFVQWRFNTILIGLLPQTLGRAYLDLLGKVYYFFNREEKEEIKRNLSAVTQRLSIRVPVDKVVCRTLEHIFIHYYEKLYTAYGHYDQVCQFIRKQVKLEGGQNILDEALSQGRGLILTTGHFGAVEFLPSVLALNGYPVTMVVRFKTKRLKRALNQRAARLGITLLDANAGENVIFGALRALRSNQILITECDEFEAWRPCRNRSTRFFGCSSPLDRTLDLLHRRYNSPVIMGLVCRVNRSSYELKLHSLSGTSHGAEAPIISERALSVLEQYIYLAPHQWYQWEQVRVILGTEIIEETRPIYATEADRSLPGADSSLRTF